jgi:hypothetical protein
MTEHRIGTREEWQAAHQKLVERDNELAEHGRELASGAGRTLGCQGPRPGPNEPGGLGARGKPVSRAPL